jgi:hypothetical protein
MMHEWNCDTRLLVGKALKSKCRSTGVFTVQQDGKRDRSLIAEYRRKDDLQPSGLTGNATLPTSLEMDSNALRVEAGVEREHEGNGIGLVTAACKMFHCYR